ncbi:MAG: alkaline phosphatase family protein [Bacteroidetes bacterium]|nr:MAG: alkaline phosphatase family protein [Bacteroidota bacterium]
MKIRLVSLLGLLAFSPLSFAQKQEKPKLVVGIVIDQMCYDYLYRFEDKLGDKGFLKLMYNGSFCRNAHYNYVPTYTGPGHASIYTGTTPTNHGIIANDWYVPALGREMNCVEDSMVQSVGADSKYGRYSPANLKAMTITDQLRLTYKRSKVISVSIKNRSAILPGGHLSNGSYWYDYASGHFISSSFFMNKLPKWVKQFNTREQVPYYMEQSWKPLLAKDQYDASDEDDRPYEHILKGKDKATFPYDFKELSKHNSPFELFTISPFANTYLTDFAIEAIRNEELGADEHSDFLCISYSTPDIAGHSFGPYSKEMQDMYLRLDLEIEKLLVVLESMVGKENFVLFLTADHAVVPVPQFLKDHQLPGGYVYKDQLMQYLEDHLAPKFGKNIIDHLGNFQVFLNKKTINEQKIDQEDLEEFLARILRNFPGIKNAYTHEQLEEAPRDQWHQMVQAGHEAERSGDVAFILESGYLMKSARNEKAGRGTSHGSAFNYDTQVPLIWYGANIPAQVIDRRIIIPDIATTLAPILKIQRPSLSTGNPILEILK